MMEQKSHVNTACFVEGDFKPENIESKNASYFFNFVLLKVEFNSFFFVNF